MKNIRKLLVLLLCAALAIALPGAAAFAAEGEEPEPAESVETAGAETAEAAEAEGTAAPAAEGALETEETKQPSEEAPAGTAVEGLLVCAAGQSLRASEGIVLCEEGGVVYNNGATVYNNGGTVFNNFGAVFNNAGTAYNNSGTAYANGGVVYNNAGTVYVNGGELNSNGGERIEAGGSARRYLSFAEEYSLYADYEGVSADEEGRLFLEPESVLRIRPMEGFAITAAGSSSGSFAAQEDGSWLLSDVTESCTVTLAVRLAAPTAEPAGGVYAPGRAVALKAQPVALIRYTLDGSEPNEESEKYEGPITLEDSAVLRARAFLEGVESSETLEAAYTIPRITAPELAPLQAGYGKDEPSAAAALVENGGTEEIVIRSVQLAGKNAASFTLSTQKGGTVAAGETDGETWTVTPKSYLRAGSYETTMIFTLAGGEKITAPVCLTVEEKPAE